MKEANGHVVGYKENTVPYTLNQTDEAPKGLVICLPGLGYTVEGPLFRYATGMYLLKGYDVLHINYQYKDKLLSGDWDKDETYEAVKHDGRAVIDEVLNENNYDDFYLIGKSIGTLAVASELKREAFSEAKVIWATPLLDNDEVYEAMIESNQSGLCIMGDDDKRYIEERFHEISQKSNISTRLFPGINHSLEYDDEVIASIEIMKNIMIALNEF